MGIDRPKIYSELLKEMKQHFGLDAKMTRHCIEANNHNNLTAFYHLLIKQKRLEGYEFNHDVTPIEYSQQDVDEIAIIIQDPLSKNNIKTMAESIDNMSLRVSKLSSHDTTSFERLNLNSIKEAFLKTKYMPRPSD